jgi:hypothetical protein
VVRGDVVVDEEAPGSSLVSRGGLLLRRAPCTGGGVELAIGATPVRRGEIGWRRVFRAERGRVCVKGGRAEERYL